MSNELTETIVESRKVQDADSCYLVTLPKNAVTDLGIEPGMSVFFTGQEGDSNLELHTPEQIVDFMHETPDP